MTTSVPSRLAELSARLPALCAEARERAPEFEQARQLSADFAAQLADAGLFRLLVPAHAGGLGATLPQWLDTTTALAEADASTGWVTAHANTCATLVHACGTPALKAEFFADPRACASWSMLGRVEAREQPDGLRITGSWGFESGCTAATVVGGMVMLPPLAEGQPPRMLAALAPARAARIEPTWDPVGLAGTGSHDVHFDDVLVPWHRTFAWPAGQPAVDDELAIVSPGGWIVSISAGAVHLGLARRALDEARAELRGKRDRYSQQPLLDNGAVQRSLEAAEGLWMACRAGLREALASAWDSGLRGVPLSERQRLDLRLAATTATQRGIEIVRAAYDVAGAAALRRSGPLQRLLRDASALGHHVSAHAGSYELTGRVRCGIDRLSWRI